MRYSMPWVITIAPCRFSAGQIDSQSGVLSFLAELGFPGSEFITAEDYEEIEAFCLAIEQKPV
jgi:hypothetical protein